MKAFCPQQTENENRVLTHALTHEQKKWDGNSGTKRICGCENPAAKPLYSPQIPRKAALSNLHTHEATGSSPVVSTTRRKPAILWNTRDSGLFCFRFFRCFGRCLVVVYKKRAKIELPKTVADCIFLTRNFIVLRTCGR